MLVVDIVGVCERAVGLGVDDGIIKADGEGCKDVVVYLQVSRI